MGIENISILTDPHRGPSLMEQAVASLTHVLIEEHKRGMHPYGSMVRECPLCQANK